MLNNYLFYSLNKENIRLEKTKNKERMKEAFDTGITCYTTFFPTTKVIINVDFR